MKRFTLDKKTAAMAVLSVIVVFGALLMFDGTQSRAVAALTEADCRECHTGGEDGNMADEHHIAAQGKYECLDCHSSLWDPSCMCNVPEVIRDCTECHSDQGHVADHEDNPIVPYNDCKDCHDSNVLIEHVVNRGYDCDICHDSDDPIIQDAIERGKNGETIYCADCHDFIRNFGNHERRHDKTALNSAECAECHDPNAVTGHEPVNVYCFICHNNANPAVKSAIDAGMAEETVYCSDCHPSYHDGSGGTQNQPPVADAGADTTVLVNQSVSFNGDSSYDPDGLITQYLWNFGDGATANGSVVSHTYTSTGTFTAILTVTDNDGASNADTRSVTVLPPDGTIPPPDTTPTTAFADEAMHIEKLEYISDYDFRGDKTTITSKLKDGDLYNTSYRLEEDDDEYDVITVKLNTDSSQYQEAYLKLYIRELEDDDERLRIYPYQSNGYSIRNGYYVNHTVYSTGWKTINITPLLESMQGYGWMKFRIVCTTKRVKVSEAEFELHGESQSSQSSGHPEEFQGYMIK